MKTSVFGLLSLFLATIPLASVAQTNIKSAFDAIIKCPEAKITESHTLDKDPGTNVKTGQSDVYSFVLPASKMKLVTNVISAFDKDSEMAYGINRGQALDADASVQLVIGDGSSAVRINEAGTEYLYALYLAPLSEDAVGKYRYAYGINYKEVGRDIVGKLIVTYATTLKYRQQSERERQMDVLRSFSNGAYVIQGEQQSWFEKLMSYFQSMTTENTQTRIALATKAYTVIRDTAQYPEVTEADKYAIREILEGMLSDRKYSETVLNRLLHQCLEGIK
ncbi:MAG: hypothetical protein NC212_08270 [Staphylococcus sp.]|nr:hypothetical protein [Staphylococcus sp.]